MVENRNPWIACVAKENYDNFLRVFGEAKHNFSGKKPVIFGAGIMGLQFCHFLREAGVDQVLFCDLIMRIRRNVMISNQPFILYQSRAT